MIILAMLGYAHLVSTGKIMTRDQSSDWDTASNLESSLHRLDVIDHVTFMENEWFVELEDYWKADRNRIEYRIGTRDPDTDWEVVSGLDDSLWNLGGLMTEREYTSSEFFHYIRDYWIRDRGIDIE